MAAFDPKKIGERIRSIRGKSSRSDTERRWGISPTSLQRYEKGQRNPDTAFLATLASEGIDIHWLVTGEEYRDPAAAGPVTFHRSRLAKAVELLEEALAEGRLTLTPAKKAELIAILYEEITEWEIAGKPDDREKVAKLVRLAS